MDMFDLPPPHELVGEADTAHTLEALAQDVEMVGFEAGAAYEVSAAAPIGVAATPLWGYHCFFKSQSFYLQFIDTGWHHGAAAGQRAQGTQEESSSRRL